MTLYVKKACQELGKPGLLRNALTALLPDCSAALVIYRPRTERPGPASPASAALCRPAVPVARRREPVPPSAPSRLLLLPDGGFVQFGGFCQLTRLFQFGYPLRSTGGSCWQRKRFSSLSNLKFCIHLPLPRVYLCH